MFPNILGDQKIARSPGDKPETSGATGRAYRVIGTRQMELNPAPTLGDRQHERLEICEFVKFCVIPPVVFLFRFYVLCQIHVHAL